MDPFVSPDWLAEHREDVVIADARMYLDGRSAEAAYLQGHLPGAVFVDVATALAAPDSPEKGRHPLPTPEDFAAAMSRAGIGDDTTVVAYDDVGNVMAARLIWMLRTTGHRAALLDGGLSAAGSGELERRRMVLPEARFTPVPWPRDALASIDEAVHGPLVVDARDRTRFAGNTPDPVDPRSGHIPGAVNVPCREHLTETDPATGGAVAGAIRARGGHGRAPHDLLLRLRCDGVPQPPRGRARGTRHGTAVPRELVPVLPHGPPRGDVPSGLNHPSRYLRFPHLGAKMGSTTVVSATDSTGGTS